MTMQINLQPGTPAAWGLWCPKCLLPSAIEVPMNILRDDGVVPLGSMRYCKGCRER